MRYVRVYFLDLCFFLNSNVNVVCTSYISCHISFKLSIMICNVICDIITDKLIKFVFSILEHKLINKH